MKASFGALVQLKIDQFVLFLVLTSVATYVWRRGLMNVRSVLRGLDADAWTQAPADQRRAAARQPRQAPAERCRAAILVQSTDVPRLPWRRGQEGVEAPGGRAGGARSP